VFRAAALLLTLSLPLVPAQAAGPVPPCESVAVVPAYGPIDGPPAAGAWGAADLRRERWLPPACLGWQGDSRLVVALAARFHSPLSLDALAGRLTAVSGHASIKYWTVTHQQWRPLAIESSIVDGPGGKVRLSDPPRGAVVAGRDF
jgi:hypothetical protein